MKNRKGITLIGLVITIIIILVLSGITLSFVLSDKGILNQAKSSKSKTDFEKLKEDVALAYLAYKAQSGDNKQRLTAFLKKLDDVTIEELASDTWCVTRKSDKVTVKDDGEITSGEVDIWDKTSIECPEIKLENGIYNWYIYRSAQMKFLANFVNNENILDTDMSAKVAEAGYTPSSVVLTADSTVFLMNNLDMGARPQNGNWETEENETSKWIPIGVSKTIPFIANFDGNNNSITGIYVDAVNYVGLFGYSKNSIKNLTIKNSYIKGSAAIGGIVGVTGTDGEIDNCHNINTVVLGSQSVVGGIVGQLSIDIKNCTNSGYVCGGTNQVGGITGRATVQNKDIINCTNNGKIEGYCVGGIVGYNQFRGLIDNCVNNGSIESSTSCGGGIVGYVYTTGRVNNCINNGKIKLEKDGAGGIIGVINSGSNIQITNCINNETVDALGYVGGIIGQAIGTVENCENRGKITAKGNQIGGIAGRLSDGFEKITNSTNYGDVYSDGGQVGGICGTAYKVKNFNNCKNYGTVQGKGQYTGGIVGIADTDSVMLINYCENNSNIFGGATTGGVVGFQDPTINVENCKNIADIQSGGYTDSQSNSTGGIVGAANGSIKYCINTGNVLANEPHKWNRSGGIAGSYGADSLEKAIENCENYGNISALGENTYMAVAGGIIGDGNCTMVVTNCYNSGNIYANKVNYAYLGGILGRTQDQSASKTLTLNTCYSKGTVKAETVSVLSRVGSIGGTVGIAGVTDSYYYNGIENCPKALNNQDFENEKVMGISENFNSFEEFFEWLSDDNT